VQQYETDKTYGSKLAGVDPRGAIIGEAAKAARESQLSQPDADEDVVREFPENPADGDVEMADADDNTASAAEKESAAAAVKEKESAAAEDDEEELPEPYPTTIMAIVLKTLKSSLKGHYKFSDEIC